MRIIGTKVTIDTSLAQIGDHWLIEKREDETVSIVGGLGNVHVAAAPPITIIRALLAQKRALWPGLTFGAHGIAFGQIALERAGSDQLLVLACCVGFFAHMLTIWPLADAYRMVANIRADLVGLQVKFKIRTGEDA